MDAERLLAVLAQIEAEPNPCDADIAMAGAICSYLAYRCPSSALTTAAFDEPGAPLSYVTDELRDAEKYIAAGETEIARDELRHAQHFIDKVRQAAYTPERQAAVRDLQMRHDLMAQSIG